MIVSWVKITHLWMCCITVKGLSCLIPIPNKALSALARLRILNVLPVRPRRLNPCHLDFILDLKLVLHGMVNNRIPCGQRSTFEDPGKDAFLGHDAVTRLVVDRASGMALLPDLGDFQQRRPDAKAVANADVQKVDAACSYVFGEVARRDIQSHGAHFVDALLGQQADLSVTASGMGVAGDAVVADQVHPSRGFLSFAFIFAGTDGQYVC